MPSLKILSRFLKGVILQNLTLIDPSPILPNVWCQYFVDSVKCWSKSFLVVRKSHGQGEIQPEGPDTDINICAPAKN